MTKPDAIKAAINLSRQHGYKMVVGKFLDDWIFANSKDEGFIAEMSEVSDIDGGRDDE